MNDFNTCRTGAQFGRTILCLLLLLAGCATTKLELTSTPEGASVWLDSSLLAVTPTTVKMKWKSGKVLNLQFRKDGYEPLNLTHSLSPKQSFAHGDLEQVPTRLEIDTVPGATIVTVRSNGRRVIWEGQGSVYRADADAVALGSDELWGNETRLDLQILIESAGYTPQTHIVPIARGSNHKLSYVLQEAAVRLEITSKPTGATVYDRRLGFLGTTPMTKSISRTDLVRIADDPKHVDQGTRLHLTFTKPGYEKLERSMPVKLIAEVQSLIVELALTK